MLFCVIFIKVLYNVIKCVLNMVIKFRILKNIFIGWLKLFSWVKYNIYRYYDVDNDYEFFR